MESMRCFRIKAEAVGERIDQQMFVVLESDGTVTVSYDGKTPLFRFPTLHRMLSLYELMASDLEVFEPQSS